MYIGNDLQIAHPSYKIIDDISSGFNGSTTSFALQVSGATPVPFPISTQQVMISVNGVVQEPDPTGSAGFKLLGSNIIFSSAPANGHAFFGVINAGADYVTAGSEFPDGSATAPSFTFQDDQDTGWFRIGSGSVGYSANGVQTLTFDGNGLTVTGDASFVGDSSKNLLWDKSAGALEFADNAKAVFGAGSDLTLYHNGTNSIVGDTGAGELSLQSNGTGIRLWNSANGETLLNAINNGAVELYHNGLKTVYTTSLGVDVKGGDTSSKTQLSIWGNEGQRGVLQISADDGDDNADHWQFQARTDGNLNIQNLNSGSWGNSAVFVGGGSVMLYNNNVKVFETVNNGVKVSGTEGADALLYISADEGDDNADQWRVKADTSGNFGIDNYSTGSWVNGLTLNGSNNATFAGTVSAQTLTVNGPSDANARLNINAGEGRDVELYMAADEGDDNSDKWMMVAGADNIYFKSYSTGSWVTALNIKNDGAIHDSKGDLRKIPINAKSSSYTLISSDAGKTIRTDSGVTVPAGIFYEGEAITIFNNSGSDITITQGSNQTMYNAADAATGNRTLAGRGLCTVLCVSNNVFAISGAGLS